MVKSVSGLEKNKKAQDYLKDVFSTLERNMEKIVSVILFGSFAKGGASKVSDVDLLIIINDESESKLVRKMDKILTQLESKHNYIQIPKTFIERPLFCIERKTGMFASHFVCTRRDLEDKNFSEIFGTGKFLTRLLAPTNIVINDLIQSGVTIYGKDVLKELNQLDIKFTYMIKSILMNFLLAVGTILISPFSKEPTKYSMESVKWSLLAVHYYLTGQSGRVSDAVNHLDRLGFPLTRTLRRLEYLRKNMENDLLFVFKAPITVLVIHMAGLKFGRG